MKEGLPPKLLFPPNYENIQFRISEKSLTEYFDLQLRNSLLFFMLSSLEPRTRVAAHSEFDWVPIAAILESNQLANRDAMWPKNNEIWLQDYLPFLPATCQED